MIIHNQEQLLKIVNQVYDLERKTAAKEEFAGLQRNIGRIRDAFSEMGLHWASPEGEPYNDTRTDCEASIAGESSENLYISEVLKPIVWIKDGGLQYIIQKAVVIAESQT
ncbi:MAG: hypothetical protein FD123_944 [Bacteroidetes bacterium]|nr:MAG: hypothetical protein FD123_944 [Bacteroidota bacterium]